MGQTYRHTTTGEAGQRVRKGDRQTYIQTYTANRESGTDRQTDETESEAETGGRMLAREKDKGDKQ